MSSPRTSDNRNAQGPLLSIEQALRGVGAPRMGQTGSAAYQRRLSQRR